MRRYSTINVRQYTVKTQRCTAGSFSLRDLCLSVFRRIALPPFLPSCARKRHRRVLEMRRAHPRWACIPSLASPQRENGYAYNAFCPQYRGDSVVQCIKPGPHLHPFGIQSAVAVCLCSSGTAHSNRRPKAGNHLAPTLHPPGPATPCEHNGHGWDTCCHYHGQPW